jgi:phage shock protein E
MKKLYKLLALSLFSFILLACATSNQQSGLVLPNQQSDLVWIDVRTSEEYEGAHLEGAMNIEFTDILAGVGEAGIDKDAEIQLYCGSGRRAGIALEALESAGFTNVVNRGGFSDLID